MRLQLPSDLEKYRAALEPLARVSSRLVPVSGSPGVKESKFGGEPFMPAGFQWPKSAEGEPLAFLMQVNFAEAHAACPDLDLPPTGLFQVFYDFDEQPWGGNLVDKKAWRFYWYPDIDATEHVGGEVQRAEPSEGKAILFEPILTVPDYEDMDLPIDEEDEEEYNEFFKPDDGIQHQLGGWPNYVQGAAFDDCAAGGDKEDWRLLLQIDSDEIDLNYCWGDVGKLYIGVRSSAYASGDFSNPWLVLQCY